jgi:ornithine cyclodeaminase
MFVVDEATCQDLLDMREAVPWLAESYRAISTAPSTIVRGNLRDPERSASGLLLGGYISGLHAVCLKLVGTFNGNSSGLLMLVDTTTGAPEAVVAGSYVTDFRTGAASGAATEALARAESARLAILGTGRQAATQLAGMLAVRPIEHITVWNRTQANARDWVERQRQRLGSTGPTFAFAATPEAACSEADIVVVSTSAGEPFMRGEWLRPGMHVNAVGSGAPHQQELNESVLTRADLVVVDSRESAFKVGDFIGPLDRGAIRPERVAEIGEVLLGQRPGRTTDDQITLFKSVGHAANDVAIVRLLIQKARETGRGLSVGSAAMPSGEGAVM